MLSYVGKPASSHLEQVNFEMLALNSVSLPNTWFSLNSTPHGGGRLGLLATEHLSIFNAKTSSGTIYLQPYLLLRRNIQVSGSTSHHNVA